MSNFAAELYICVKNAFFDCKITKKNYNRKFKKVKNLSKTYV